MSERVDASAAYEDFDALRNSQQIGSTLVEHSDACGARGARRLKQRFGREIERRQLDILAIVDYRRRSPSTANLKPVDSASGEREQIEAARLVQTDGEQHDEQRAHFKRRRHRRVVVGSRSICLSLARSALVGAALFVSDKKRTQHCRTWRRPLAGR